MDLFTLTNVTYKDILTYPDIAINQGNTTFLAGPSGVGKSTLLKLLNGVFAPTTGCVTYNGVDITTIDSIELRRRVLLVGQSPVLFEEESIKTNFATFFNYRELTPPNDAEINEYLTICSIEMPLDKEVYHLSGGEKQRVFIAIHLALGFDVLMLDEPTSALDYKNSHALLSNIKSLCASKGKSLIIISHDQEMVTTYADDVVNLGGDE